MLQLRHLVLKSRNVIRNLFFFFLFFSQNEHQQMKHSHGSLTTVCGPLLALGLHLVVHNMILVVTWFHIQWWCVTTTTTTTTVWPIICLFYNCSFIKCNFKSSCCFPLVWGRGGLGGGSLPWCEFSGAARLLPITTFTALTVQTTSLSSNQKYSPHTHRDR